MDPERKAQLVELGLPEFLIIDPEVRRAAWKGKHPRWTAQMHFAGPKKDEDPATKALRKEIAKAEEKRKAERFARLNELKARTAKQAIKPAADAATQEADMATKKTAKKTPAKRHPKLPATHPANRGKTPKAMQKPAAKPPAAAKAPKATTTPAPGARADGLRAGSKQAVLLDLMLRPQGVTEAEACKELGWKKCRVTMKRTAEKAGASLTTDKAGDGVTVFKATMPKKAA